MTYYRGHIPICGPSAGPCARRLPGGNQLDHAVEELFGVKVAKVNTISVRGRYRRQGMHAGYTAKSKKAIVTLKPDSKEIEFFNSMV